MLNSAHASVIYKNHTAVSSILQQSMLHQHHTMMVITTAVMHLKTGSKSSPVTGSKQIVTMGASAAAPLSRAGRTRVFGQILRTLKLAHLCSALVEEGTRSLMLP